MERLPVVVALVACASLLSAQSPRPVKYFNPAWSPHGRRIAFESTQDGKLAIFTVRRDGADLRRLTSPQFTAEQPSWSPDGLSIVYSSDHEGERRLFLMSPDGGNVTPVPGTERGFYASFSADGKWIVFSAQDGPRSPTTRVIVIRSDGSERAVLGDSATSNEGPRWSTDGTRVIYTEVPILSPAPGEAMREFAKRRDAQQRHVSSSLNGNDRRIITEDEARRLVRDPSVSADGRWQALVNEKGAAAELAVRDRLNGGEARILPP